MKVTTTIQPVRTTGHRPKRKELVAWLEANWRATWIAMASVTPGAEVKPIHSGLLVKTGLPVSYFNMAMVDRAVRRPDRAVKAAESYFAGLPFCVVFAEGHVDMTVACENAGLTRTETIPGMAMAPLPHATVDPTLTIEPLTHDLLPTFLDVFCASFGLPREMAERLATHDYVDLEQSHDVVAFVDGDPVAVASTFESMGVVGVYNVGTMPDHRGNGYGEAVTWAVVEHAKKRGCHTAVLQSSDMGFGVYRRMGFEVVSSYCCYTNEPEG
ncbi:MAG TPA: GNAT family N-acetyltransferase [Actinomycetota bacterium]|nr:GNAT family N-acetyltransferase [Actinomycetota bacterium]